MPHNYVDNDNRNNDINNNDNNTNDDNDDITVIITMVMMIMITMILSQSFCSLVYEMPGTKPATSPCSTITEIFGGLIYQ